jgi:sulfur transfer complex TusBCD TusB component (DsrH family)
MALHLIACTTPENLGFTWEMVTPEDCLVFLGEGIYALAQAQGAFACPAFALGEDVSLRFGNSGLRVCFQEIDYTELVGLTLAHCPLVSWYD